MEVETNWLQLFFGTSTVLESDLTLVKAKLKDLWLVNPHKTTLIKAKKLTFQMAKYVMMVNYPMIQGIGSWVFKMGVFLLGVCTLTKKVRSISWCIYNTGNLSSLAFGKLSAFIWCAYCACRSKIIDFQKFSYPKLTNF